MVTTRRSSFGVQDGDMLALRSRSIPLSPDATPSRKRKDTRERVPSSSRKKRKLSGREGADDAVVEQTPDNVLTLNEDESSVAESAASSSEKDRIVLATETVDPEGSEPKQSKSWLEDNFVPLSLEAAARQLNAQQPRDVAGKIERTSPKVLSGDALGQDAEVKISMNYSTSADPMDHQDRDMPQHADASLDRKRAVQVPMLNVHKRFGSEDPVLANDEDASIAPKREQQEGGSVPRDESDDAYSEDDAPEVVGSKSVSKDVKLPTKAPRKAKRKAKPSRTVDKQPTIAEVERAPVGEDLFLVDSLPEQTSSHQRSNRRKLFHKNDNKVKDIIKDGVTYRTVFDPTPAVRTSKEHKTSHLPPTSNTNSWRLRKQVLGRKKVQHVWGGRSAFLRS
jgi:hypothetical protein